MKKNNDDGSVSGLLMALIFSVIFSSSVIAFILMQMYGITAIAPTLPIREYQDGLKFYDSNQNYETGAFDLNITGKTMYGSWSWVLGTGLTLDWALPFSMGGVLLEYIQKDSAGLYQNSYWLDNSVHSDYCVVLRYTSGSDTNEVCADINGFFIPSYFPAGTTITGHVYDYPYPNANQDNNPVIKTIYNDDTHTGDFYYNGNKLFTTNKFHEYDILPQLNTIKYAGVRANTAGFVFEEFQTESQIINPYNSSTENPVVMVAGFILALLKILVWNVDSQFLPLELNIIFIKTQLTGIIVCIVIIIRGGG